MPESEWIEGSAPFKLTDPLSILIEPIRPSGFTESGLYVIDQEGTFAAKTSMLMRVIGKADGVTPDIKLGAVYVCPVYNWEDYEYEGVVYHISHQSSCLIEVEGYDDA